MADYHTTYSRPEGETTQWEDLQRKFGNLPPAEPVAKPKAFEPYAEPAKDAEWIDKQNEAGLEDLEDEVADDTFLEEYRRRRLQELQDVAKRPEYGRVTHITAANFVAEVTQASETAWVVVHLHKDKVAGSAWLAQCLEKLAAQHPGVKFVRIVSTECITNYPDANVPTLLLYRGRQCLRTVVGLDAYGGRHPSLEGVQAVLERDSIIAA